MNKPRILVCTPHPGPLESASCSLLHKQAWLSMARDPSLTDAATLVDFPTHTDLVRARSRFVRVFLEHAEFTHLLFWDADVAATPELLRALLGADKPFVAAAYRKKNDARDWAYRKRTNLPPGQVEAAGLGFALLRREVLERMVSYYRSLVFVDDGCVDTVALFQLIIDENRELLSEDYSFCKRWRELDGEVWLYTGPPVAGHVGTTVFR